MVIALEEGIEILNPAYWVQASDEQLAHVFRRSASSTEDIPLLGDRIRLLREAGSILCKVSLYHDFPFSAHE